MNWSNFAVKGPDCEINKEVEKAIRAAYENGLVIGAMCIAPVVIARVLGKHKIAVTIGTDTAIGAGIEKWAPFMNRRACWMSAWMKTIKS